MMEERDMERSRGENRASEEEELQRIHELNVDRKCPSTDLMRTKSCMRNLYTAFVGCVM